METKLYRGIIMLMILQSCNKVGLAIGAKSDSLGGTQRYMHLIYMHAFTTCMHAYTFPLCIQGFAKFHPQSEICSQNKMYIWLTCLWLDAQNVYVGRVIKDVYVYDVKCIIPLVLCMWSTTKTIKIYIHIYFFDKHTHESNSIDVFAL